MRPALRYGLTFFAGALTGAVLAGGFVGWHWNRNFVNWYVMGVADQANVAREIHSGRGRELAGRIMGDLLSRVYDGSPSAMSDTPSKDCSKTKSAKTGGSWLPFVAPRTSSRAKQRT